MYYRQNVNIKAGYSDGILNMYKTPKFILGNIGDYNSENIVLINVTDISHAFISKHMDKYFVEIKLKNQLNDKTKFIIAGNCDTVEEAEDFIYKYHDYLCGI